MPLDRPATTPGDPPTDALLEERGSFSHGVCRVCGWRGPGRRARRVARLDLSTHLGTCPGAGARGIPGGP